MDAIKLLKKDHDSVKRLLKKLPEAPAGQREQLLAQIGEEIKAHSRIEEEIFYPAFVEAVQKKDRDLYFEAREEHHVVDLVLLELQEPSLSDERFKAKATVLQELVEHHIKEEEKEMFPKAKKALSKEEIGHLGERMAQRKEQLLHSLEGDFGSARTPAYAGKFWR